MVVTDKIALRQLEKREWIQPQTGLRKIQTLTSFSQFFHKRGSRDLWKTQRFRKYREEFQAALFSYALQQNVPSAYTWEYSYGELPSNREFDCAIRCKFPPGDGRTVYKYVQLKEFAPSRTKSDDSLQFLIDKLAKYTAPPDERMLVVGIYINRATKIRFRGLKMSHLAIEQLWLYGFLDDANCFLVGNLLDQPQRVNFAFPRFQITSPTESSGESLPHHSVHLAFAEAQSREAPVELGSEAGLFVAHTCFPNNSKR